MLCNFFIINENGLRWTWKIETFVLSVELRRLVIMNNLRRIPLKYDKSDTQDQASSWSFSRVESTKEQGQAAKVRGQSYLVRSSDKTTHRASSPRQMNAEVSKRTFTRRDRTKSHLEAGHRSQFPCSRMQTRATRRSSMFRPHPLRCPPELGGRENKAKGVRNCVISRKRTEAHQRDRASVNMVSTYQGLGTKPSRVG
jgi:hypothetical protein